MNTYFDSGADKEIDEDRLHFGLTTLEVITTDQAVFLYGQFNKPCNICNISLLIILNLYYYLYHSTIYDLN